MRTEPLDQSNLYLFHEGTQTQAYALFGAHPLQQDGQWGTRFAVWAPHATNVWIEGDFNQQMSLNNGPWTFTKVWKKTLKLGVFYLIAVFIANIFLSYIIGSDAVLQIISEPISQHFSGFITLLIFYIDNIL